MMLSTTSATQILARWERKRLFRGRTLWMCAALLFLPLIPSGFGSGSRMDIYHWVCLALSLAMPLLCAGVVGDEIQEQTASYLFTRPFSRTAMVAGRLLCLVPIAFLLAMASAIAMLSMSGYELEPMAWAGVALGLFVGTLTYASASVAWGALVTKRAIPAALGYLLVVDVPLSALPVSLRKLSIAFHTIAIADHVAWESVVWLTGMCAFWWAITRFRLRYL
jgi:ABC-type transport system involved in multi-copper enzyme maturation permease subunit